MLQATGLQAPSELRLHHIMRRVSEHEIQNLSDLMQSVPGGALLESQSLEGLFAKYWKASSPDSFQLST
jgi:hypothetical protein